MQTRFPMQMWMLPVLKRFLDLNREGPTTLEIRGLCLNLWIAEVGLKSIAWSFWISQRPRSGHYPHIWGYVFTIWVKVSQVQPMWGWHSQFFSVVQVFDFPSLCLSPVGANAPNLALETPEKKKGQRKPRLWTWGLLHCMSPPFLLPSNSSLQNAPEGRSLSKQSTQNSLNVQTDSKSVLGLLVELRVCGSIWQPKHQQSAINAWTCRYSEFLEQEAVDAGSHGTVAIYFSGAVASWRPLLGEMLGVYVAVTGLRRKMIQLGLQRQEVLIYVATRKTLVFRINPTWVDSSTFELGDAVGLCEHKNSSGRQKQPNDDLLRLEKVVPNGDASFIHGRGSVHQVWAFACYGATLSPAYKSGALHLKVGCYVTSKCNASTTRPFFHIPLLSPI